MLIQVCHSTGYTTPDQKRFTMSLDLLIPLAISASINCINFDRIMVPLPQSISSATYPMLFIICGLFFPLNPLLVMWICEQRRSGSGPPPRPATPLDRRSQKFVLEDTLLGGGTADPWMAAVRLPNTVHFCVEKIKNFWRNFFVKNVLLDNLGEAIAVLCPSLATPIFTTAKQWRMFMLTGRVGNVQGVGVRNGV